MADDLISPTAPTPASGPAPAPPSSPGPRPSAPENPRARGHSPARDRLEAVRAATTPSQTPEQRAASAPPATDPPAPTAGETVKVGDMEVSPAELQEFFRTKGETELRKATLPASPTEYKTDLPANFEMPAGIKVEFDEADPLLTDARNWAHGKGFSQSDFSELVGIYATAKAKEAAFINTAAAAEVAKLGANGTQRVTALETWMRGMVGDKLASHMRGMLVTADIVKGWELIQQKFSSQGAASFSQAGRDTPDGNKIPGYDKMSFEQKRYAQDQLRARR